MIIPAGPGDTPIVYPTPPPSGGGGVSGEGSGAPGSGGVGNFKTWIPFTVSGILQAAPIASAVLTLTATQVSAPRDYAINQMIFCENSVNVVAPTTWNELNMRMTTVAYTLDNATVWAVGGKYDYDVTACVQELVNLPTWTNASRTIAFILNGGTGSAQELRMFAAYENATYDPAQLTITF
jgi:hypothetical protein